MLTYVDVIRNSHFVTHQMCVVDNNRSCEECMDKVEIGHLRHSHFHRWTRWNPPDSIWHPRRMTALPVQGQITTAWHLERCVAWAEAPGQMIKRDTLHIQAELQRDISTVTLQTQGTQILWRDVLRSQLFCLQGATFALTQEPKPLQRNLLCNKVM